MAGIEAKLLDDAEDVRSFDNGRAELVTVGGATVGRFSFEPGWRWSESVKKIVGTDSCQVHHVGYVSSGRLHVVANDGSEQELMEGQAYSIPPGHDAWVVGDAPFVGLEFKSAAEYARPS